MKPYYNYYNRQTINICVDYVKKWHFVSKLVYITWVGEIPDGLQVDHIDGNKNNNSADNLRLLTALENVREYYRMRKLIKTNA